MSDKPKSPEENSDSDDEIVIKRRIDRRLEASAKADMPWTRRVVGLTIIVLAFAYGWRGLNQQSLEAIKFNSQSKVASTEVPTPESTPTVVPPSTAASTDGMIAPVTNAYLPDPAAKLDGATLNTISECTKGVGALRLLDFDKQKIADGDATLESIFKPVLIPEKGRAKRTVQLQNVRIRLKNGDELRLHAVPKTQSGDLLYLKLFRVAGDGLPEEFEFPEAIKDLKDQPLSDFAITKFLQLAEVPGRALEVERHESWSFPEKVGAQVIWSGDLIAELQVFARNGFLSCSRGQRAGLVKMNCKCVSRSSK